MGNYERWLFAQVSALAIVYSPLPSPHGEGNGTLQAVFSLLLPSCYLGYS